jgi:dolichol-phosphate mannosyltransferase
MITTAKYSIVIPIFNEEATILELWQQLSRVIAHFDGPTETIFVNDGSTDKSLEILNHLHLKNPQIKIINLSRNFGHQAAITAGLENAQGEAVILMDGDLQDEPRSLPDFIKKWQEGFQVVYAVRIKRKENIFKRNVFKIFYLIQSFLAEVSTPLDSGIFSLLDRKAVSALKNMPERNKYLSGLRAYAGFRQTGITVERNPRYSGRPRVTLGKLFKLAFDGIFSFSKVPLKIITWLGILSAATAFILGLAGAFYKIFLHRQFFSWAYGLTTTFFIGGVQMLSLGIIGEYIGRIYDEVKQRPYYIIAEKIGFEE